MTGAPVTVTVLLPTLKSIDGVASMLLERHRAGGGARAERDSDADLGTRGAGGRGHRP
ncbi:hypothetical protein ACU686_07455 [Yinghuangia aomiensis]